MTSSPTNAIDDLKIDSMNRIVTRRLNLYVIAESRNTSVGRGQELLAKKAGEGDRARRQRKARPGQAGSVLRHVPRVRLHNRPKELAINRGNKYEQDMQHDQAIVRLPARPSRTGPGGYDVIEFVERTVRRLRR